MSTIALTPSMIQTNERLHQMGRFVLINLALILSGLFSIYLPSISPVPFTLQAQLIFFLPLLLGRRVAFYAIAAYLLEAALGLPISAGAGGGIMKFVGPTAGYLFFFLISPFVIAPLYERLKIENKRLRAFSVMGIASLLNFIFGVAWLSVFMGLQQAILCGFLPYVLGDFFKLIFFSRLVKN
ncbi:MAG: biotin transporter BioY [Simkaniaceae bacterium]|nr:biotin transporter BioY [Simkaniaceae bacterium]